MNVLIRVKVSEGVFPVFALRGEYGRVFKNRAGYVFAAVGRNIRSSYSTVGMSRNDCRSADDIVYEPYQIIAVHIEVVQAFVVR